MEGCSIMADVKSTSDAELKKLDNFIPKFRDVECLNITGMTHIEIEITKRLNVLIDDYKARYHD